MNANDDLKDHSLQPMTQTTELDAQMDLERIDPYLKRAAVDIRRSKARTANHVALILVIAVVLSLPLYVVIIAFAGASETEHIDRIFGKWYDVVSPLLGAAIGAMFGIAIGSKPRD